MADKFTLPSYADLDLKNNQDSKIITVNGVDIEVFQYLPILEKYKLINLTLAECLENNVYNPIKAEVFFNLNLIFNYTTLTFTAEELINAYELFDKLEQNKVIEKVIATIPEDEYKYLLENLITTMTRNTQYIQSVAASLDVVFENIPKLTEGMDDIKAAIESGELDMEGLQPLVDKLGIGNMKEIIKSTENTKETVEQLNKKEDETE